MEKVIAQHDLYTFAWQSDFEDLPFNRPNEYTLDSDVPSDTMTVPLGENTEGTLLSDEPQVPPNQNG